MFRASMCPPSGGYHNIYATLVFVAVYAIDTVVCAPDDGWRYHAKYVEQFPEINKLHNFAASCWIYIGIYLQYTDPWTLNKDKISTT